MITLLIETLVISLVIQAVFFAFAATLKTDKVTDLSYGLTFVALALHLQWYAPFTTPASLTVTLMVVLWGARLAGYLLYRIVRIKRDVRFDGVREHFWKFLQFWLFQGLAVWVIMLPVTMWFAAPRTSGPLMVTGVAMWLAGLVIETVADAQKFAAKTRPGGGTRWMSTGLWQHSRHPNYFGELLCWWGVFLAVAPALGAWAAAALLGPATITYLLLYVTGIPTLEKSAREKWGRDPAYQEYVRRTNRLVPWKRSHAA